MLQIFKTVVYLSDELVDVLYLYCLWVIPCQITQWLKVHATTNLQCVIFNLDSRETY